MRTGWIRIAGAILLNLALSHAVRAQTLPNRSEEVKQFVTKYASLLDGTDEKGRRVTALVCADLNVIDHGLWGLLIKNDRTPPFIPYDILVWQPTREHVDILSGFNPTWIPHEPIPVPWSWLACPTASGQPPASGPTPAPRPVFDGDLIAARLAAIEQVVADIRQQNLLHETAEAADRTQAAQFREDVRSAWRDRFVFLGKYIAPLIGGVLTGWKLP